MINTSDSTVTASLHFDYQGRRFSPSISVNLHRLMIRQQGLSHIYDLLGASIGLDAYRHEYDVMVMHDITFSDPTGLACAYVSDGQLDFDAFAEAWKKQRALNAIQPVAQKQLNISDLDQHPDIRNALVECFNLGMNTKALESTR